MFVPSCGSLQVDRAAGELRAAARPQRPRQQAAPLTLKPPLNASTPRNAPLFRRARGRAFSDHGTRAGPSGRDTSSLASLALRPDGWRRQLRVVFLVDAAAALMVPRADSRRSASSPRSG